MPGGTWGLPLGVLLVLPGVFGAERRVEKMRKAKHTLVPIRLNSDMSQQWPYSSNGRILLPNGTNITSPTAVINDMLTNIPEGVRPIDPGRPLLPGERDPVEGLAQDPVHNATTASLDALLTALGTASRTHGGHHKVRLALPSNLGEIGFMLWLPPRFVDTPRGPWPTVFSLHGRGEVAPMGDFSQIEVVVKHGLQHRMAERRPLNEHFVLITPQLQSPNTNMTLEQLIARERAPNWLDFLEPLDALRRTLFTRVERLDRSRAYLTGVSIGGTGVWSWAGFNPSGAQPWAAVFASSACWPKELPTNNVTELTDIDEVALRALARIPTRVAHCANDADMPIYLGALLRPRCLMDWSGRYTGAGVLRCNPGADAVVEALRHYNATDLTYDRIDVCPMVFQPTDTSYTPMFPSETTARGHDSASIIYASEEFVQWLEARRLPAADRWW